jgi:hypothetical protein
MFSGNFQSALADYLFLLRKKYPSKTILNLVATRYSLSAGERSVLFRGVMLPDIAEIRKSKLIEVSQISGIEIQADALNVILTIVSYLRGTLVYLAMDGFLRDTAEYHGRPVDKELLERAVQLLSSFLLHIKIKKIIFYVDEGTDLSSDLAKILKKEKLAPVKSEIILLSSADHPLKKTEKGIIASSDSDILDRTPNPVIDLPRQVLEFHFKPEFVDIENYIKD